ncbi:tetratricopeptide repeat protein [Roseomonas terrae]|uniref:Tetratricopeptide repeat protein 38 n=1 Tax=Neoroseomonas terrae TaxID=424799 RepID=A0ABS5EI86_9PROT|nr:tetratricopeptide repeat protein [Neoroseomonas terrae]MBR0650660.1 tetratricopeptide repeat protein [Neoroseomonas terrae]
MLTDRYGLALSTASTTARDAYVEGCDLLLSANVGAEDAFRTAIAADPRFALAHAALARGLQLRGHIPTARQAMEAGNALLPGLPAREASHMAFYALVLAGQGDAAVAAAKVHLATWPRDAMVLSPCTSVFGLIGFSGRAGREREQVELLDGLATHYGDDWWFNTQHAFALLESGQLAAAHPRIESAMAQMPRNAHGAHIRAHLYYEDGEQAAALAFLKDWMKPYPRAGQLHCHISWHIALCELEAGDAAEAFRVYAEDVAPGGSWGPAINTLTDAVSFLWRAELAGHPRDPARWRALHDFSRRMFPRGGIAFADTHAALADAVEGDGDALEARLRELETMRQEGRLPSGPVVPGLARAFAAFLRNDFRAAIAAIEPVLADHERIGGSRAQRDLVEFTLMKAYLADGRLDALRDMLAARHRGPAAVPVAGLPGHH